MNEEPRYVLYTPQFQFLAEINKEIKGKKFMGETITEPLLGLNFKGEHEYELARAEKDMFVYIYSRTIIHHSFDLINEIAEGRTG